MKSLPAEFCIIAMRKEPHADIRSDWHRKHPEKEWGWVECPNPQCEFDRGMPTGCGICNGTGKIPAPWVKEVDRETTERIKRVRGKYKDVLSPSDEMGAEE